MKTRPERTINLSVPHTLLPGDCFELEHFAGTERLLVTEVSGQKITVTRCSWWHDHAYPWFWKHTHRRPR